MHRSRETITDRSPLLSTRRPLYTVLDATPNDSASQQLTSPKLADFFIWLSSEVEQADKFYIEQEADASRNVRMLETQVDHFLQHKAPARQSKRRSFLASLDLPSLPLALRPNGPRPRQSGLFSDHEDDGHVSYWQAKHMLRTALREQYAAIKHLQSYRDFNLTAVRKVVKKFDKTLETTTLPRIMNELKHMHINSSNKCGQMMSSVENMYAKAFEQGNHKHAVESLTLDQSSRPHNVAILITGMLLGLSIPLLVRATYVGLHSVLNGKSHFMPLLQIWGGALLLILMLLGMALNVIIWRVFRINYPFIFEFDRSTMLDWRQVGLLPSMLLFLMCFFAWLTFDAGNMLPDSNINRYFFCIFLGVAIIGFLVPVPYLLYPSRKWLSHGIFRLILSGTYPVEFRDFFLGDLGISLNSPISNFSYFICVYSHQNWGSGSDIASCGSTRSRSVGFLTALPGIWRFLQCLRRFGDSYDWFPHLLNAGKYTFTILYNVTLSLFRISPQSTFLKVIFITCAVINGVYSASWDIFMDFSLAGWELRETCIYPSWVYRVILILDPLMRQNWLIYLLLWNNLKYNPWASFIVSLVEVSRRIMWANIRVENEHAANVSRYRAFRDLELPYGEISTPLQPMGPPPSGGVPPRRSFLETPRFRILQSAHVRDFQRRTLDDEEEEDSDADSN